jgi:hypothetical protein
MTQKYMGGSGAILIKDKKKVKVSRYRPGRVLGVPGD